MARRDEIIRYALSGPAGTLRFTLASLYETLYRLEERGQIRGRWVEKAGQRRRRYYKLTTLGRRVLDLESQRLKDLVRVLEGRRRQETRT